MIHARLLLLALLSALSPQLLAVTVAPAFSGSYTAFDLGSIAGLPTNYGGLIVKDGDPNTLLIGGQANSAGGRIYAVPVTRNVDGHITGFGTPVAQGYGANNDGGIAYGPGKVLFYSKYDINRVGQVKPGSNTDDKVVQLAPLGIATSTGALNFVPPGFNGAGRLKIGSYSGGQFYDVAFSADANGTYNLISATLKATIPGGPEGIVYVPSGSPVFSGQNMLFTLYSQNKVVAYGIDAEGNPTGSPQDFVTGLNGGEGATIDPVTGDFLFSTFGASNRVIQVRGFKPPPPPATTTLSSSANPSLQGLNVTFTATVSGNSPTGTVTFKADGADITGCVNIALSSGVATCTTAALAQGSHAITALYGGDSNNGSSNGSLTQVVNPATLSVSATAPGGGGYVLCQPSTVSPGGNSTCTATPDLGYQVEAWSGACASWTNNSRCHLYNIQTDQVSTVSFSPLPTYSVTASVLGGFGGTVSCTPATVIQGGSSSCTAVPAAGYQVGSWGDDCATAGSNVQCTLTNIQSDQVATVSFAPIPPATYTVAATAADPYGTASCLPNTVKAGENSACYAVPMAGFRVKSWSGACALAGSNAQCALTNINANQASTVSFELIPPATYTVSATVVGGNYGLVSCLPDTVKAGEDSTCYAVPYAGFRVQSWGGDCAAAGSNAQCALTKIQANQTATVSFELIPPATFTVTATVVGGNGNVSCLPTSVIAGNSSTCHAVPYAGFQVQSWGGACAAAGNAGQCSLPNIQTDQTATVSFEPVPLPTYTVSATVASGNGTVDCAPASVTKGDSSHCTAVPAPGWQVTGWTGACAATGANASCFLPKIQQDEVSTVSFGLIPPSTYHISASVVLGNGSVSCTPDTVTAGGQSTCTAVPAAGYQVQNWGGACQLAGSNAQCFLSKIKKDQTATVSFALLPPAHYTVSATVVGGNGSVSCTPGTVTAGDSSSCTAVPDAGFEVQGWTGACAATGSGDLCALANIQTDQTSTVSFAALPVPSYTISATASGGNGTVSCAPSPVPQGGSSACTAVPALGYQVQGWTGDCAATGANVQCALSNIQTDQSSTVSFSAIPVNSYHISATVVLGNGSVSCTPTTVTKGGTSSCTALPAPGWQVLDWGGACAGTGANAQCFLPKIRKNEAATVSFALILPATHSVSATVTGGNGSVSCTPTTVTKNDASTCLAVPDPGYQVQSWTGACAGAGSNPQCYLTKIQKDAVSTVSFVALPVNHYAVSAAVIGGNGTVSCTPTSVTAGQGSTCTAVPEPGYQVQSWSGACLLAGSNTQCSLTNIQTDQSSTVSFAAIPPITYTVAASVASGNGSVSCVPSPVIKGGSSSCTAVPAAGWQVQNWTGACAATGGNVQCFLPKVQRNVVSTVSFVTQPPRTYSVSATVALGLGAVSCTPASVSAGGGSICTAVPDSGYQVQSWGGACAASGASAQCSLGNIAANQVATVSFVASPPASYLVTASVAAGNGSVSCTPASVSAGGSSVCVAIPDSGYQVAAWTGACAFAGSNAQCTLSNIQSDQVSTVSFVTSPPATYTVNATVVGGNGSVSCQPTSVVAGGSSTCTAVPAAGFQVQSWTGACAFAGKSLQCVLTNIQTNLQSTVSFVPIQPLPNPIPVLPIWGLSLLSALLLAVGRLRL